MKKLQTPRLTVKGVYILERKLREYVGTIHIGRAMNNDGFENTREISYMIDPTERNKGYATEALRAVTDKIVAENSIPLLHINARNTESQRVAEKAHYFCIGNTMCDYLQYETYIPKGVVQDIKTKKVQVTDNQR